MEGETPNQDFSEAGMMNGWKAVMCCAALLGACGSDGVNEAKPTVDDVATNTDVSASGTDLSSAPTGVDTAESAENEATVVATVVAIATAPCDLVTSREVTAATGLDVVEVIDEPPLGCIFDLGDEAGVDIWVARDDAEGRLAGPASVFAEYASRLGGANARAVDGVGEAAIFDRGFRALAVDAGGGRFVLFAVNGGYQALDEPLAELTSIAQAALTRI